MKRKFFTFASLLSLLLFLATMVLWVRSYFVSDRVFRSLFRDEQQSTFWRQSSVRVGFGEIGAMSMVQAGPRDRFRKDIEANYRRFNLGDIRQLKYSSALPEFPYGNVTTNGGLGFRWWHSAPGNGPSPGFAVVLPLWFVALLFMLLPGVWFLKRYQHWRRVRRNLCLKCGYVLVANTSGVCPECGTAWKHSD